MVTHWRNRLRQQAACFLRLSEEDHGWLGVLRRGTRRKLLLGQEGMLDRCRKGKLVVRVASFRENAQLVALLVVFIVAIADDLSHLERDSAHWGINLRFAGWVIAWDLKGVVSFGSDRHLA